MHKKSLIDKKIPVIIRFTGILWNIKVSNSGEPIVLSVVYYPDVNKFRGNVSLQMVMKYYQ